MRHLTTQNRGAQIVIELLATKGVEQVVLSPGSRNAPLVLACVHHPQLQHTVIVDERSAAFYALGIAQQSGHAVALICTSGTALLNYAPAVAEAYYQQLPLIVISADRPLAWIDQEDSQTIRQHQLLAQIVKGSYQLPSTITSAEEDWFAIRQVNEAINLAREGQRAPVHINVPLGEPLYETTEIELGGVRTFESLPLQSVLPPSQLAQLRHDLLTTPRVMVVAGFLAPDEALSQALTTLAQLPNVVVLTENISNLRHTPFISTIDRVLAALPTESRDYAPQLLITLGGALVSKRIKGILRHYTPSQHWCVGVSSRPADTMQSLTTHINLPPSTFFTQLVEELAPSTSPSSYAQLWQECAANALARHQLFAQQVEWSDWQAFATLLPQLPAQSYLQLSNGTSIRYAQLFDHPQLLRCDANRGTSGIDGSTSTAIGATSLHTEESWSTLITGDISFMYDANALWIAQIPRNMRIFVLRNGGGGIFRYIIPEQVSEECVERYFETAQEVDVERMAQLHHLTYLRAESQEELQHILDGACWQPSPQAMIIDIVTPREINDKVLKGYFAFLSHK